VIRRIKDDKILISLLASIFILMLVLAGRMTYAYLTLDLIEGPINQGEITASGDTLIFSKGTDLTFMATTDNFNVGSGNISTVTYPSVKLISSPKTNNAKVTYSTGIVISENTYQYSTLEKTAELVLTVLDENNQAITNVEGLTYVTVGEGNNAVSGFDVTGKTGVFNIVKDRIITTTSSTEGTTHQWTYTLTFVNFEYDQSINETASFDSDVFIQKEFMKTTIADGCTNGYNLAQCIIDSYTEDGELNLYYHDGNGDYENANLEAGDNSYRLAGSHEDVKNYVCFGSDAEECPDENLYRIIGVFNNNGEDQVKLIKWDFATSDMLGTGASSVNKSSYANYKGALTTIPTYYWSGSCTTSSTTTWSESILNQTALNTNYITYLGSKWTEMIATTTWKVGGNTWANIVETNAKTAYTNEIVNPAESAEYDDEIGLMYVSDYYYAASPTYWSYKGSDTAITDYRAAINENWMYSGVYEWLIARRSDYPTNSFYLYDTGDVSDGHVCNTYRGVRPVFNLKSSVVWEGGDGSTSTPMRIGI